MVRPAYRGLPGRQVPAAFRVSWVCRGLRARLAQLGLKAHLVLMGPLVFRESWAYRGLKAGQAQPALRERVGHPALAA